MNKSIPSVTKYISDGRAASKTDSQITAELLDAGWQMDVITLAMHGEQISPRRREPILDIKKQPIRKGAVAGAILLILAMLLAAFA